MLAIMFLFLQISFISSGTCSAPKLLKFHFCYKIKQSVCVYICIFIKVYYLCPIFNCFRKIILVHSDNTFILQSWSKDEAVLKISFVSITSSYNSFSIFVGVQRTTTRTSLLQFLFMLKCFLTD